MSFLKKHFSISMSRLAKLSIWFLILGFFANLTFKHFEGVKAKNYVLGSDTEGYYQYLPYVLLKDKESIKHMGWTIEYKNGNRLNAFTCGVAIMQLPFFVVAHGISKYLELETSGYTSVYFTSVFFATLFYVLLGLIFLYKTLLRFFKPKYALWTTLLMFYATNLFYYTIMSPGMSHAYSFSLIAIYLYFVPQFYDKQTLKNTLGLIIPFALAVLIRPTNIVAGLYFLLFGITSFKLFAERIQFLFKKWYWLSLMAAVSIIVFFPQMLYWKYVTGEWIVYSYQHFGFPNWKLPHVSTVLIGKRNGLFLYTPLMLLACLSMFYLVYKKKLSALAILLIMVIIVYVNASWWVPTFSAAAGYRALIEFFPLLAIPLAFVIQNVLEGTNKYRKVGLKSLLIFFVVYNVLFAYKYSHWLWWDTEWQWSHFLRLVRF